MANKITELFNIKYPIVQAGMIWCSGWKLAAASANAGILGLIGSGSMHPEILKEHIKKCKNATKKSFGVNLPLMYPDIDKHIKTIIEEEIKIVFTSGGNPKIWTKTLKENGIKVVHVVPGLKYALKAQEAGVDAIVAEGFEAGGHNGREEITTMCLIQLIKKNIDIPLIAAGGIATGAAMLAAMVLGADGVQIGSRFAASVESSAHPNFKQAIIDAKEDSTILMMKKLIPVRLIKNKFAMNMLEAENKGLPVEELKKILGKSRAKKGMFEGDLNEGELEIGQISSIINDIKPVKDIVNEIINEFNEIKNKICKGDII